MLQEPTVHPVQGIGDKGRMQIQSSFQGSEGCEMTRRTSRPKIFTRAIPTKGYYVAPNAEYRSPENIREYHLTPTRYPSKHYRDGKTYVDGRMPLGLVDTSQIVGPSVKRLTFGYLNTRLKDVPVDQRQSYARKVLSNERTPQVNRETMLAYIESHQAMFTPYEYLEDPGWDEYNRLARVKNGPDADPDFIGRIRRMFGCR